MRICYISRYNKLLRFIEKPDIFRAKQYIKSENFLWNSGIFCATAASFIKEMKIHCADILNQSPTALQLRYLQTLSDISTDKNSTIIFPIPIDFLSGFQRSRKNYPSEKDNVITDSDNFLEEFDQNENSMSENYSRGAVLKGVKDPNKAFSLRKSATTKKQ